LLPPICQTLDSKLTNFPTKKKKEDEQYIRRKKNEEEFAQNNKNDEQNRGEEGLRQQE
jgi:hypothetical protein